MESSITDDAMKTYEMIDMILTMSNYEGSDADDKHDGYANDVKARSVEHIRKYVVVGAPLFARAMIAINGLFKPVETRIFSQSEEKDAWAYLAEAGSASGKA